MLNFQVMMVLRRLSVIGGEKTVSDGAFYPIPKGRHYALNDFYLAAVLTGMPILDTST